MRWKVDDDADSSWFIRLSPTQQDKAQETALVQLHEMERLREEGLLASPRWIVVTLENSGGRKPTERYDLLLMRLWISEGWLRRVVFRNEKRLARDDYTVAWCREVFDSTGTEIFFTEYERPTDWSRSDDRFLYTLKGMLSAEDRRAINEQTQRGLDRRYTDQGKGWPGLQKIGLQRDPLSGHMVEDEHQTEMIVRAATMFVEKNGIRSGIRHVADEMTATYGFEVSPKQWERIFKDEGYVTGDFSFNRTGRGRVYLKHIDLVNPIPRGLFQKLQEAFATNRGNTRSRPGDFVLLQAGAGQDVPASERGLFCKRCGKKLNAWLQGDLKDTRYRHHSPIASCCRQWGGPERATIEAIVMPALWQLEAVSELREAATLAAAEPDVPLSHHLDAAQRRQLKRQILDIDRAIERLGRAVRSKRRDNPESRRDDIDAYNDLVRGYREDKRHLEARLKDADVHDALQKTIPADANTGLGDALREVLTVDVPDDDAACRRRAAVVGRLVTRIVIDKQDDGSYDLEIYGPLIPRDVPILSVPAPSEFALTQLHAHQAANAGNDTTKRHAASTFSDARADMATRPELRVSSQGAPYDETCKRHAWLLTLTCPAHDERAAA